MSLERFISISGLPGVYSMVANRKNGLIVEDLKSGKKKFAPARNHQFTPLESVAIFTEGNDSVELKKVFTGMNEKYETIPPIATKSSSQELYSYFEEVLPNFDRDKVYPNDIKKIIKWFNTLKDLNLMEEALEDKKEEEEEE